MRAWRGMIPVLAVAVAVAACGGGGGDDTSLSLDTLDDDGACPVDLDAAADAEGLGDGGADVEVEVDRGSGEGGREAAVIDQVGGVYVECSRPASETGGADDDGDDGAELSSHLFASEQPGAIAVLLPLIQVDLELGVDDLNGVLDRFDDAGEGEVVDLGADGPGAAARIAVDGAESAVLYVRARDGAASPDQVRAVLDRLLDRLSSPTGPPRR